MLSFYHLLLQNLFQVLVLPLALGVGNAVVNGVSGVSGSVSGVNGRGNDGVSGVNGRGNDGVSGVSGGVSGGVNGVSGGSGSFFSPLCGKCAWIRTPLAGSGDAGPRVLVLRILLLQYRQHPLHQITQH